MWKDIDSLKCDWKCFYARIRAREPGTIRTDVGVNGGVGSP